MPGGSQTQTTQQQFSPQLQQFMESIFGTQGPTSGFNFSEGFTRGPGTPGTGLADLGPIFGNLQPQAGPLQRQSTNAISHYLNPPAPEQRTFDLAYGGLSPIIQGQGQFGNVDEAAFPIFQRNLNEGLTQLGAQAPQGSRFGSALLQQGTDLSGRATQDYQLFIEQARQRDIQNRIQSSLALGTLGSAAGQNPFGRAQGAGQLGLQQSIFGGQGIQNRMALIQSILQMLGQSTGQTTTTQSNPGFLDYLSLPFNAAAGAAGYFLPGRGGGTKKTEEESA